MRHSKAQFIIGTALIAIGVMLLISNITNRAIGWNYFGPAILMLIGILFFATIKNRQRTGAIFPGMIFFLTGLALFLANFPNIYNFLVNIQLHTFVMIVLGLAFLALYLTRPQDFGLLIPTAIFIVLGILFILNDFWIIDEDMITRLWPLIPIFIGIGIIIHEVRKKPRTQEKVEV